MYKINNKYSLEFISQYVREDFKIKTEDVTSDPNLLLCFVKTIQEAGFKSFDILNTLNKGYLIPFPIQQLLKERNVELDPEGVDIVTEDVRQPFDAMMLDLSREATGYTISESGKVIFNKKKFAESVIKTYRLLADQHDPDNLLIYNKYKGMYEDAYQPLHRLIIQMAHAAGDDTEDIWSIHLEKSILEIIKRIIKLKSSRGFNQKFFPLGNYTLNSETGDLVAHSSNHLATFGSNINYESNANCSVFKRFLSEIFDDFETIEFIQEWFGYTLSSTHKANALMIGVGSGANGKSTLFDILSQIIGIENVASAPLSNFNTEFGLEPLLGKKLNLATESDINAFKTGKLKALTAGEDISINRKNKTEVTTTLPTKLIFLMNELPLLHDNSFGFERRLLIVPFDKIFLPHEQDKELPQKLKIELEGILVWALDGLKKLIRNDYNFTISKPMLDAKDLYFGVGDPVGKFVENCIEPEPSNVLSAKELLNAYITWMNEYGYAFKGTHNPQVFWDAFERAMNTKLIEFKRSKSNGKMVVRDITLK